MRLRGRVRLFRRRTAGRPARAALCIALSLLTLTVAYRVGMSSFGPNVPNLPAPSSNLHSSEVCVLCPYLSNECVPPADCNPPCSSFSVDFDSVSYNAAGTSITADWSSNGAYSTTYEFGYGLEGGSTTWVSTGSGTTYTLSPVTPGDTYTLQVKATMTCPSGAKYTASTSENVTPEPSNWTVTGTVELATPTGASKNTPVYGAQVYVEGTSNSMVTGNSGSYSLSVSGKTTSIEVCAQAPGLDSNSYPIPTVHSSTQCDPVTGSPGGTISQNLLLQTDSTLETPSDLVFANLDGCFPGQSSCAASSGVSFSQGSTSGTGTSDATYVQDTSVSIPTSPDCNSVVGSCYYVSFSGTVPNAGEYYSYWDVLPMGEYGSGTGLPLSAPMQLVYYVYLTQAPSWGGVAVDLDFVGGTSLHSVYNNLGSHVLDQHGNWIAPSYQILPAGQWIPVVVDLSELTDKTISEIAVGFDDGDVGDTSFQAYFSGIEIQTDEQSASVVNGNFDSGLNGWTSNGSVQPTWSQSGGYLGSPDALVGATSGGSTAYTSEIGQEFRVPDVITGGSICLNYDLFTNEPTAGNAYQRVYLDDRTTGTYYYLVGTASSSATSTSEWLTACLNLTGGSSDLRGDRVWVVVSVSQTGDGYYTWAKVDGIYFTPDDLMWYDENSENSNDYGYNGASVTPLYESSLVFNTGLFPLGNSVQYQIPFSAESEATATYNYNSNDGIVATDFPVWTAFITAGLQFINLIRGPPSGEDYLHFLASASAGVGYGKGTPQNCNSTFDIDSDGPCLYVDGIRLGVGFACDANCGSGTTEAELIAGTPQSSGGAWGWNLAPVCQCTSGDGLGALLDTLGIAVGIAGIVIFAPESGGASLALLPDLIGLGIDSAGLAVDLTTTTSGLSGSGLSCTSSVATACDSYGWWSQQPTGSGPTAGAALMAGEIQWPELSSGTLDGYLIVITQLQLGEYDGPLDENSDVANINEVYLVDLDTGESDS